MIAARSSSERFEAAFSDQFTHPADYFSRATIVLDDVVQNLTHLSEVGRIGREQTLRRLGIAANGGERLIQFMGQGRREFAHGVDSRYMGEFVAMALHRQRRLLPLGDIDGGADPFADFPVRR